MLFTDKHEERMRLFCRAGLYFVTSQSLSRGRTTLDVVREALAGGVRLVQLREKEMPDGEFYDLAVHARRITSESGALLIINDRLDVAIGVGADGVHLGLDDFPAVEARRIAPDLVIGASTHSKEEAVAARENGASYVNIGPLFPTGTKAWKGEFLGIEGLVSVASVIDIPFTVMGGIKEEHIPSLLENGVRTVAVVTAVTQAEDPAQAVRSLLEALL